MGRKPNGEEASNRSLYIMLGGLTIGLVAGFYFI